jgi:hypothetical protein
MANYILRLIDSSNDPLPSKLKYKNQIARDTPAMNCRSRIYDTDEQQESLMTNYGALPAGI